MNKPIFGQLSHIFSRVTLFVLTYNTTRAVVWVKIFINGLNSISSGEKDPSKIYSRFCGKFSHNQDYYPRVNVFR